MEKTSLKTNNKSILEEKVLDWDSIQKSFEKSLGNEIYSSWLIHISLIKEFNDLDLKPMVGLEFEAYVFERDEDGIWIPYNTPGAFVYGTGPTNDPKNLMGMIWERATEIGLPVESINGEYDNGQFELTLCFADALKACDDVFLFRTMAKEIAFQNDLILTFLPKPIPDRGG